MPHYLGDAFGWDRLADRPWDAIVGDRRHRHARGLRRCPRGCGSTEVAVVSAAIALFALAAAVGARASRSSSRPTRSRVGVGPRRPRPRGARSRWRCRWRRWPTPASRRSPTSPPRPASPGARCPRSLFVGIGAVVVVNVAGVDRRRARPIPRGPDPSAPDGVASALGADWLQAPLVGIAQAIGDELPGGGARRSRSSSASRNALVLVTIHRHRHGRRRAPGLSMARYDMLPHVFARPEKRRRADPGGHPRRRPDRRLPAHHRRRRRRRRPLPRRASTASACSSRMTAAQVAVVRLRIREPDLERPFRVPCGVRVRRRRHPAALGRRRRAHRGPSGSASLFTHGGARIAGPIWLALGVGVYLVSRRAAGRDPARARHARGARPRGRRARSSTPSASWCR